MKIQPGQFPAGQSDTDKFYEIIKLREHPQLAQTAAQWFHEKWGIPLEAYLESISECVAHAAPGTGMNANGHTRSRQSSLSVHTTPGTESDANPDMGTGANAAGHAVPQWYLAESGETIIGGLGVIENDFHDRKDLAPNVCAVYVEEAYRCQGIAGRLLDYACKDMRELGISMLYLITDHTSFYERYGWEFLCMVQGDGEPEPTRMYVKRSEV